MRALKNGMLAVAMAVVMFFVTSCGTLLHPERRGQRGGRLDPTIVVLDGIGLLFFLIPGIIAFAVDFSNGTIYLPAGEAASLDGPVDIDNMKKINVPKGDLTKTDIESLVRKHTGKSIDLERAEMKRLDRERLTD